MNRKLIHSVQSSVLSALLLAASNCTGAFAGSPASGDAGGLRLEKQGVTLDVRALADRLVFCIDANKDMKVSAQFGVEFKVSRSERALWNETFPKIVDRPQWYFDLPLRIDLKTLGKATRRRVSIDMGACSSSLNTCMPIKFDIVAPAYQGAESVKAECGSAKNNSAHRVKR